ncbi:MAG: alpha/beta hydrolase [Synechococcales bacterium]|nr:alpha/beta hydrolase [Synechococcales bacterium]
MLSGQSQQQRDRAYSLLLQRQKCIAYPKLWREIVARSSQPVYFIAGKQDRVMEPKYVHHLASFHPYFYGDSPEGDRSGCSANVLEIPNCGHLAMLEQPQVLAHQIRAIVAQPHQLQLG